MIDLCFFIKQLTPAQLEMCWIFSKIFMELLQFKIDSQQRDDQKESSSVNKNMYLMLSGCRVHEQSVFRRKDASRVSLSVAYTGELLPGKGDTGESQNKSLKGTVSQKIAGVKSCINQ